MQTLIFFLLTTSAISGVLDIDAVSTTSFSIQSSSLNVYDSIVYHITGSVGSGLSLLQVDGPKSCNPVSGGFSFPQTPLSGSVYINFQNPGTFYISTLEGCSSGQVSTVTVAPPPVNPYSLQSKVLIEQINKFQQSQQSSAYRSPSFTPHRIGAFSAIFALLLLI